MKVVSKSLRRVSSVASFVFQPRHSDDLPGSLQSFFEIVLLPTVSLSFSGRFMPRLMTSEKLSPAALPC